MTEKYEMRIVAADFTKTIDFGIDDAAWEEVYSGAGAVIGDEPEQFTEGNTVVGKIETDMTYAKAAEIMIEEAFIDDGIATVLRNKDAHVIYKGE